MTQYLSSQIGALSHVTAEARVAAAHSVRTGDVFTLGLPALPPNAVTNPMRDAPSMTTTRDWSDYQSGRATAEDGVDAYVDDHLSLPSHATTHIDALGHVIVDGTLWGNHPADESVGGLHWASIEPLAEHGFFTRGVVADIPRLHDVRYLDAGTQISFDELLAALARQQTLVHRGDALLVRTGAMEARGDGRPPHAMEPGLSDEPAFVEWMTDVGVAVFGTDTFANELAISPTTGRHYPLHRLLLHGSGVSFHEGLWLAALAEASDHDKRWDGLYVASPLKLARASASPVNPLFVR